MDNLLFPYYRSDKWCNLLKSKIISLANAYHLKEKRRNHVSKKSEPHLVTPEDNERYTRNNPPVYFPNIQQQKNSFYQTVDNNNPVDDFGQSKESFFSNRTNTCIFKMQQCTMSKMFPRHHFKTKTQTSNKAGRNCNVKTKNLGFVYNSPNFIKTEKGCQTGKEESESITAKRKYLQYLNRKTADNYNKYYNS